MSWMPATQALVISVPVDEKLAKLPHTGALHMPLTHASEPEHSPQFAVRGMLQLSVPETCSHTFPCAAQNAASDSGVHVEPDELLEVVEAPPAPPALVVDALVLACPPPPPAP
jgi:hypothetical protein